MLQVLLDNPYDTFPFIIPAAGKDVACGIFIFRPGVDGYMGCGKEKITSNALRVKPVEMFVKKCDIGYRSCIKEKSFPEDYGIKLLFVAAEEFNKIVHPIR